MKTPKIALVALLALSLGACESYGQKETGGTLIGAGLGGLLGSQFGGGTGKLAMTALGVVGGGLLGNSLGRSRASQQAVAAPIGETITWSNPQSGNYGTVTPTREGYQSTTGAYCREYQQEIVVGGQRQQGYGQACRQPDGSWQVVQ